MTGVKTTINRRSFLKVTALAGGGMMLSFSWLAGCNPTREEALTLPKEWFELNSYIKIGENGVITLMSPNPEFGSNVITSMPMILAEELDIDWKKVIVDKLLFRINAVQKGRSSKYVLLNAPNESLDKIISLIPGMRSPTILPLAQPGWSSVHSVLSEDQFWENIEELRAAGAEGILVVPIEKMVI